MKEEKVQHHRYTKDHNWLLQKKYVPTKDSLEEMDKFLEMYTLPRQNQEEIENINRLFTSNEIEPVVKKNPKKTKVQNEINS